jgi:tetratricopeptide (TPR) repeat protein
MKRSEITRVLLLCVVSLLVTAGCKTGGKAKAEGPVTEEETKVETVNAPPPEELMEEEPEATDEPGDENVAGADGGEALPAEAASVDGEGSSKGSVDSGSSSSQEPLKVDDGVNRKVQRALKQAQDGNLEGAAEKLSSLVDEPDGGFLAAYNLGVVRESQGNNAKAAEAYVKALASNPDFTPALVNLVRLYLRQGEATSARRIADKYTSARPQNLGHRVTLLEVGLAQKRYEDVVREAKELLRREERNVDAMLAMAEAHYRLGRYELSKAILERAVEIAPERGEIYYKVGMVELKRDDNDAAKANFEKAVQVQPRYPEARNNLGVLYHQARDYDGAIEQFEKALAVWPGFKQAYLNLGNAHKGKGQFREAEVAFKKALSVDKDYLDAHFNLAILYLESEVPGMEKIPRLQLAIDTLNNYKSAAKGRLAKGDPADAYIAEARKAIEEEKARQELMRQSQMGAEDTSGGDDGDDGGDE